MVIYKDNSKIGFSFINYIYIFIGETSIFAWLILYKDSFLEYYVCEFNIFIFLCKHLFININAHNGNKQYIFVDDR